MSETVYRNPEVRSLPDDEQVIEDLRVWQEPLVRFFDTQKKHMLNPAVDLRAGKHLFIHDAYEIFMEIQPEFIDSVINRPHNSPERRSTLLMAVDCLKKLVPVHIKAWTNHEHNTPEQSEALNKDQDSMLEHMRMLFELALRYSLWTTEENTVDPERRDKYGYRVVHRLIYRDSQNTGEGVLYNPLLQEDVAKGHPEWAAGNWDEIVGLLRQMGDWSELPLTDALRYVKELSELMFEQQVSKFHLVALPSTTDENDFKRAWNQHKAGTGIHAFENPASLKVYHARDLHSQLAVLLRVLWLYSRRLRPDYKPPVSKSEVAAE